MKHLELDVRRKKQRLTIQMDEELPSITYVPDISSHEHEHIVLTTLAARQLRDWLIAYLESENE